MTRSPFPLVFAMLLVAAGSVGCESATPGAQYPMSAHRFVKGLAPGETNASGVALDAAGSELRQAFGEWAQARAAGDTSTFEALYDVRHFEGIRWTRNGVEKRMTWAEWNADQRSSMSHLAPPVRPLFESWPGGTLDAATGSVSFDELAGSHRVVVFGRATDGKLRVVREELGGTPSRIAASRMDSLSRDAKVVRLLGQTAEK
jgi:hypothetical protein